MLGVLGRPHGVRGELVFRAFNPDGVQLPELELPLVVELRRGNERRASTVASARPFQDGALVRMEGIADRDAAAGLTGFEVSVARAELPPLEEGEHYVDDLVGCAVFDLAGQSRGRVAALFWNGGHDVLSVLDDAGKELLIPAVPEFLTSVDLVGRRIVIDPHE